MLEDVLNKNETDGRKFDTNRILFEKEPGGVFTFTVETREEGRRVAIETVKILMGNTEVIESVLQGLEEESEDVDDYQLDGNQLSYSEKRNPNSDTYTISIFQRYGNPSDVERIEKALEEMGFSE